MAIVFITAGVAIAYTSSTSEQFFGAKMVTGFGLGVVLSTTQTYISEIAPLPMRGIGLSFNIVALVSRFGTMSSITLRQQ
jgi:MFS transporter, SP family, general alpha glucoside:H+ symporter